MKVKDLIKLLTDVDPDYDVLINDNGSILNTEPPETFAVDDDSKEVFIKTEEWQ